MRDIVAPHLLRAEAVMFCTVQTSHAQSIAGHILAHRMDRITSRDIVRVYRDLRHPEARAELDAVMASLTTVGWLEPEPPTNPVKPGIRLDRESGGARRIRGQGAAGARAARENPRGPRC